jgi:hypothetical protein
MCDPDQQDWDFVIIGKECQIGSREIGIGEGLGRAVDRQVHQALEKIA